MWEPTSKSPNDYMANCNNKNSIFHATEVTEEEIVKIIANLRIAQRGGMILSQVL